MNYLSTLGRKFGLQFPIWKTGGQKLTPGLQHFSQLNLLSSKYFNRGGNLRGDFFARSFAFWNRNEPKKDPFIPNPIIQVKSEFNMKTRLIQLARITCIALIFLAVQVLTWYGFEEEDGDEPPFTVRFLKAFINLFFVGAFS